jgi:hypothetical protein
VSAYTVVHISSLSHRQVRYGLDQRGHVLHETGLEGGGGVGEHDLVIELMHHRLHNRDRDGYREREEEEVNRVEIT